MRTIASFIFLLIIGIASLQARAQKNASISKPYPQAVTYKGGIKPNHVSQETLNNDVIKYYIEWKRRYLRPTIMKGGYFIKGETTNAKIPEKGCSEGQGFGMVITALMAGQDDSAKVYFDGMYHFFDTHRSILNNELMGWLITADERDSSFDCATDGDMDIAYALLLADRQWGSAGAINYKQEAVDIITKGLKASCVSHESYRLVLGDWDTLATGSRSSDWMTAEIEAYRQATGDSFWKRVNDTIYSSVKQITQSYSPNTGLMPDFVTGFPAKPVDEGFLEKSTDSEFSWNACRYPWRIAMDYLHYGNKDSYQAAYKVAKWAAIRSGNDPANFTSVYKLDGTPIETYKSTAFTSPVLVAAMVDAEFQEFINKGWEISKDNYHAYFNDCINLMCLLTLSGNWWAVEY